MTEELRSLVMIPAGSLRSDSPPRTEWVVDFDMLAVAALGLGFIVAIVLRRRWT